ncbi:MAG TPA: antibiotic biosynthesis monooxygenase [Thermoanaerobaculia bacterium]
MFVVISRFKVANGISSEVRDAFLARPHLVDDASGFLGMEVLSPTSDPDEFWLLTRWGDETSYRTWHSGHAYRESHKGMPSGLKLDPSRTRIMTFTSFAS